MQGIQCPQCGCVASSEQLFCENCGRVIKVNHSLEVKSKVTQYCSNCGALVDHNEFYCEQCGSRIDETQKQEETARLQQQIVLRPDNKSIGLAALLALGPGILGFWGFGHFYAGKTMRGIALLATSLMLFLTVAAITSLAGAAVPMLALLSVFTPYISSSQADSSFGTLIGSIGVIIVVIVLYVIIWGFIYGWQCVDACRTVQKYNKIIADNGEQPW